MTLIAPCVWPIGEVFLTRRICLAPDLASVAVQLPLVRGHHVQQGVAVPIAPSGETGIAGVLVVGLNPLRLFDEKYQRFLELVAGEISAALAHGQAAEKLRRSEACLAEGERLSHTASWAWNVSTGEIFWSQELFRIYGLDPDKTIPDYPSVLTQIHPDDRGRAQRVFEEAVGERKEYELAYRVVWADGTIRHVNNIAHPVFDEAGALVEYIGTTIDTTERIQAEAMLRQSEGHLADAQRIGHVGSWVWNVATGECFWSREHFRIRGLDPDTFKPTKENTQGFIHRGDLPMVQQVQHKAHRDNSDFEVEYRIVRPDGSIRYLRTVGHRVTKDQGDVEFIGMTVDLTERKQAEERLQRLQAEFAEITRLSTMGELVASIAHEINQPLGAIINNSSACLRLLGQRHCREDLRGVLSDLVKDANRASMIIERVRALTKKSVSKRKSCLSGKSSTMCSLCHEACCWNGGLSPDEHRPGTCRDWSGIACSCSRCC